MWAVINDSADTELINVLLSVDRVDLEFQDEARRTALSWAASSGHTAGVRLLSLAA